MALNPSILLSYNGPKAASIEDLQQERAAIEDRSRRTQTIKDLQSIDMNDPEAVASVIAKTDPIKAQEYRMQAGQQKAQQTKAQQESRLKGLEYAQKQAASLTALYDSMVNSGIDPETAKQKLQPTYQQAGARAKQMFPELEVSEQFDPDMMRQFALEADGALKQFNDQRQYERKRGDERFDIEDKRRYDDIVRKESQGFELSKQDRQFKQQMDMQRSSQSFQAGENAKSRGVTLRGQDLADARAKEKPQASEKLTEGMRNNAMYAQRMVAAEDLMSGTTQQKPGIIEKIAGDTPLLGNETAANLARSPDRQKALQAQRDWVRAKLRKESGAAIGVDEMENEIRTYFPQLGDSTEVIAQKKAAREEATRALIQSSGGAYQAPERANIMTREQAAMPKVGMVKGGYTYIGGDPSKESSWKKAK